MFMKKVRFLREISLMCSGKYDGNGFAPTSEII